MRFAVSVPGRLFQKQCPAEKGMFFSSLRGSASNASLLTKSSFALQIPCCRRGSVAHRGGTFDATTMFLSAYGTTRCLTTQTADRQLCRDFDTGCCHAGLSDKVRDSLPFYRFRNNFVVAKKPLPLSHMLFIKLYHPAPLLFQQPASGGVTIGGFADTRPPRGHAPPG